MSDTTHGWARFSEAIGAKVVSVEHYDNRLTICLDNGKKIAVMAVFLNQALAIVPVLDASELAELSK